MKDETLKSLVSQRDRLVKEIENISERFSVFNELSSIELRSRLLNEKENLLLSVNITLLNSILGEDY